LHNALRKREEKFLSHVYGSNAKKPGMFCVDKNLLSGHRTLLKDIVQPKKRGVWRDTIRFVLASYTIADIF
jgi:hypothetical protein